MILFFLHRAQLILKDKTIEEYNIFLTHLIDVDPSHFFYKEIANIALMILDEFIWTRGSPTDGIMIVDATGFTIGHIGRFDLVIVQKIACYIQEAMPIRLKAVHVINTSPVIEILYNMIKPFMKKELIKLVKLQIFLTNYLVPIKLLF